MGVEGQQGRLDALLSGGWNVEDFPTSLTCLTKGRRDRVPLLVPQCHSGPTSLAPLPVSGCTLRTALGGWGRGGDMDHGGAWLGERESKRHTQKISAFQYFGLE